MIDLVEKTALVTGASRGIGRATALALSARGMRVHALARDRRALEDLSREGRETPGSISALPCDLTDAEEIASALGALPVAHVVVNAAGWAPPRTDVEHSRAEDWQRTLQVCLHAPMSIVHQLLPGMLSAGEGGTIVQVLSAAARRGRAGEAAYAAAKAGLRAFTQSLRDELRNTDVKVAAILPGYVDTDLIPPNRKVDRNRFLQPEDVATAVLYCLDTPRRACPEEVVIEPQRDPFARRR